jgi:integrase/recombinase XerD
MKQIRLFPEPTEPAARGTEARGQLDLFNAQEPVQPLRRGPAPPAPDPASDEAALTVGGSNPAAVYLASLGSQKSRTTMRAALNTVASELSAPNALAVAWGALRYQHAAAIRSRLSRRLAPATVNKILSALRGVAREAMRLGLLPPDEHARIADVAGVRGSRLPAGRHVDAAEIDSLFGACDERRAAGVRDAALLAVLRVGGLRRAEFGALQLEQLDEAAWTIRVQGKGNQERLAYVGQARPHIEAWLAVRGRESGPLFCAIRRSGELTRRQLGDSSVAYVLGRIATRAGVGKFSPHDLRRTFVGDLLDEGADIATVQRMAGHAQVTTTQRYDLRGERTAVKAAELLTLPRRKR